MSALSTLRLILLSSLVVARPSQQILQVQGTLLDPYPHKPRVAFRPDGSFKLTVFSDLHFGEPNAEDHDTSSLKLMRTVLADEKPDYVVINGDLVTGEYTSKESAMSFIDQIVGPLNDAKLPFSTTQGNHDNEPNVTHLAEILREQAVAPLSYTRPSPKGVGGEGGPGNYWVPVYANIADLTPALVLWFFDSRGGMSFGDDPQSMPDYVDPSVADWMKSETLMTEAAWGSAATDSGLDGLPW
ncbi:Metallo-dependent phosphatase-like protein [Mycena floridula]|nr:Metallo-dependent phosphatase-like protein [Mycena floridula]